MKDLQRILQRFFQIFSDPVYGAQDHDKNFEITAKILRVSQVFRGTREHWQNIEREHEPIFREQGNKLDCEKMVSKFIERGTKENM